MMNLLYRLLPGIFSIVLISGCGTNDNEIKRSLIGTWNCDGDTAVMETYFNDGRYVKFVQGKPYAPRTVDRVDHYLKGRYKVSSKVIVLELQYQVSDVLARQAGLANMDFGRQIHRRLHVRDIDASTLYLQQKAKEAVFCRRVREQRVGEKYAAFSSKLQNKIRAAAQREQDAQHKTAAIRKMIGKKKRLLDKIRKVDGVLRRRMAWTVLQELERKLPPAARLTELNVQGENARIVLISNGRSDASVLVRSLNSSKVISNAQISKHKTYVRGKDTLARSVVNFSLASAQRRKAIYLIRLPDEAEAFTQHRRQYRELQAVYRKINGYLFSDTAVKRTVETIKGWLKRYSVSTQSFTLRQGRNNGLPGYSIDFAVEAKYSGVRKLLMKFVSAKKPIVIDTMSLYRQAGKKVNGVLKLKARLFLYTHGQKITAGGGASALKRYRLVTLLPYPDYTDKNNGIRNPFQGTKKKQNPD